MYTARWIGEGSFEVNFSAGEVIRCDIKDGKVYPDLPIINEDIRVRFSELIRLREKLSNSIQGFKA